MKNFIAVLLLCVMSVAQVPTSGSGYRLIGTTDVHPVTTESWPWLESSSANAGPYAVLPAKLEVQLEPYRTHYDFSAVESKPNHNRRTFWLSFAATTAVLTTIVLLKLRDPQCHHYEGNQSGVNVPCPKEESK